MTQKSSEYSKITNVFPKERGGGYIERGMERENLIYSIIINNYVIVD